MIVEPGGHSLIGKTVRLDPCVPEDAPALFAALDDDRVWASGYGGGPGGRPTSPAGWLGKIEAAALEARRKFTIRLVATDRVIGTTALGEIDLVNEKLHLGWTAYAPDTWGSAVNPESKMLLLKHVFDECGFGRVRIQTDSVNIRSQAAIAKLGAVREGVVRRDMRRADGSFRDTVMFSIIKDDWPGVRAGLEFRLALAGSLDRSPQTIIPSARM